jgi:hypothetical protein
MLQPLHILLLLTIISIAFGTASNSYNDCLQVAANFRTTVSNGPVADIISTTGVNVTCPQLTGVSCPGSIVNGVCVFQQKLCITCINSSPVRIRVQSNGLPRRCASVPSGVQISEGSTDFEVNFNPDVNVNSPNQSPLTATALDNIICNISSDSVVPPASAFVQSQASTPIRTLAGIAVDGLDILNVNSLNQVDPFYPSGGFPAEGVDQCLSHPNANGQYHYHIASGCMVNPPQGNLTMCSPENGCANNIASYSLQTFSSYKTLTVVGIAIDGHVIYGPYLSSGTQVTSGFDICNGMFYDSIGNYAYFSTTTYPYITGCLGPGNYPNFKPSCTTNPPASYTKSSFVTTTSTSQNGVSNLSSSTIRFVTFFMMFWCTVLKVL